MGSRVVAALRGVRESFWFYPALMCAAAAVLAEVLVVLDQSGNVSLGPLDAIVYRAGAEGSRSVLSAVAGSTLTVAGTTFSITIAVLALASSTYGPRLVRGFMADRGNQLVLGTFVATFLYALLVLRTVRVVGEVEAGEDEAEAFVPHLAVNVAVLLAVVSVGVLVWFVHHISDSIQVPTLSRRAERELEEAVRAAYPSAAGHDASAEDARPWPPARADVLAPRGGVVIAVDARRLLRQAHEHDGVVRLRVRPGRHVVAGEPLAVAAAGTEEELRRLDRAVREAVVLGAVRRPHQDLEHAVQQLLEMAVRALSPGTNDPYTASNALDDLAGGLVLLARRGVPTSERAAAGAVRLVAPRPTLTELLDRVADAMRDYALDHPDVLVRALHLLTRVGQASADAAVVEAAPRLRQVLLTTYRQRRPEGRDLQRLEAVPTPSAAATAPTPG